MSRTYLLGTGVTSHEECQHTDFTDAVYRSASRAIEDADIERSDLDSVVMAGYDVDVGRTISNMYAVCPAGGYMRDETRVTEDGITALALAHTKVESNEYDLVMLTAYGFPETDRTLSDNLMYDPLYVRDFGTTDVLVNALQAERYASETDGARRAAAEVVRKNRTNGSKNEHAERDSPVDADEVRDASPVAVPLREPDVAPSSHGIASIVLGPEEYAARYGGIASIESIGWSTDSYYLGERSLARTHSLEAAAEQAYDEAGISDPVEQLDLVELSEVTSYHELLAYEALGLCEEGSAPQFLKDGGPERDGDVPVNAGGGSLSWDPGAASGLMKVIEVANQLSDDAGARQLDGVQRGLAHGTGRNGMQTNSVAVMEAYHG